MSELLSSLREQGKAIMVMMGIAIISVLAMVTLGLFRDITQSLPDLGNGSVTTTTNATTTIILNLFITSFGLVGSFASITMLIIVVKAIIGVVRGLKN